MSWSMARQTGAGHRGQACARHASNPRPVSGATRCARVMHHSGTGPCVGVPSAAPKGSIARVQPSDHGSSSSSSICMEMPSLRDLEAAPASNSGRGSSSSSSRPSSGSSSGASSSRRGALLQLAATASAAGTCSGGLLAVGGARADTAPLPKTCTGPDLLLPYEDPAGRFRLAVPCGWRQVTSLMEGGSVLASFYNPEEPGAETLAVYVAPAPEGAKTTADLGSPEDVAAGLARIAPNGIPMGAYGSSRGGRQYVTVHVQFGGNTAGVFGAAREFRAITVDQGRQYTLRVTSTRYRYLAHPEIRQLLAGAADGFQLLRA